MTNEHVIKKDYIESNASTEIYYNNKEKNIKIILDKNERFIKECTDISLDIALVGILPKDNINNFFLLPNKEDINEYANLNDSIIYIPQFPKGRKLNNSKGTIIEINENDFSYNESIENGLSGSPIFLENTINVLGIHKEGFINKKKRNYGHYIFPVINFLEKIIIIIILWLK